MAATGGGLAVAEGEAGDGGTERPSGIGSHAFGAEPIGVIEDGAAGIGGEVAASGENLVGTTVDTVRSVHVGVAGEIVDVKNGAGGRSAAFVVAGGGDFFYALTKGVVDVGGGSPSVNLCDSIFGVVRVGVDTVAQEISRGIVRVAVDAIVVLRIAGIVASERGDERVGAVLLPAVAKAVVNIGKDSCATAFVGASDTIEWIVSVGPIAVGSVIGGEDVSVGSVATVGNGQVIKGSG